MTEYYNKDKKEMIISQPCFFFIPPDVYAWNEISILGYNSSFTKPYTVFHIPP